MEDKMIPCPKCEKGIMLPIYDYTQQHENVYLKGWVCSDPTNCGNNIFLERGSLVVNTITIRVKKEQ